MMRKEISIRASKRFWQLSLRIVDDTKTKSSQKSCSVRRTSSCRAEKCRRSARKNLEFSAFFSVQREQHEQALMLPGSEIQEIRRNIEVVCVFGLKHMLDWDALRNVP